MPDTATHQQIFIDYVNKAQPQLINAAKSTLAPHNVKLITDEVGITIEAAPQSAYKQFFTLLLKQTWESDDRQLIIGFCALIRLLNTTSTQQPLSTDNLAPINHICESLWRHVRINITDTDTPMEIFNITNIEKVQTIDCPLDYISRLPKRCELYTRSTGLSSFLIDDMQYHANILFKHHIDAKESTRAEVTINGKQYRVIINFCGTFSHNAFKHIEHNSTATSLEDYIQSKAKPKNRLVGNNLNFSPLTKAHHHNDS